MNRAKKDLSFVLALLIPVIANGEMIKLNNKYVDSNETHITMPKEEAILPEDVSPDNENILSYKKANDKQIVGKLIILDPKENNKKIRYTDSKKNTYNNPNISNYPLGALKKRGGLRR